MEKAYDPKEVEKRLYAFWQEKGFFKAQVDSSKPAYCIVMPPPNVTGVLHMGHALVNTVQDILIRYKRMRGFEALWVPGTDHAGISTQTVVERHLIASQNKRRTDFSREDFLKEVWCWKEKSEKEILGQLRLLGCSCDWDRQRFTMDPASNRAVKTLFKRLFDRGLIYRGNYLVNWDPVTQTALADDEVEHEQQLTFLWHIRYPFSDGSGHITVATTRPETLLGDTAVAVSPSDPRYAHLVGKTLDLPLTNRQIPLIADPFVDPSFGSGAVKITPAHDHNDYQMGLRHDLLMINILTPDGRINEAGGAFSGLSIEEARKQIVSALTECGALVKTEPHENRVGISYRSKAVIQPYLSEQWFLKMTPFKELLIETVREKRVELIPEAWENTYYHWIENLRDWCISRQLWWGHQIPIWYDQEDPSRLICFEGEGLPPEVEKEPHRWKQDPDVLDTWFSSALWPFSTLGWPDKTPLLERFYPNSTLITGHDILFFWVARMILMGHLAMGDVPFKQTFLHGLIYGKSYWREKEGHIQYASAKERVAYDKGAPTPPDVHSRWEKMSKSKGNVIDPLELIDSFGTDAVRMALASSCTHARQIDLDIRRFEEFKNFANKLWNGSRFVFMNLSLDTVALFEELNPSLYSLADKWILSRLNTAIAHAHEAIEQYAFDRLAQTAYSFFWDDFCAYYVELSKPLLKKPHVQQLLLIILTATIRLLHPLAPFITEALFEALRAKFPLEATPNALHPYLADLASALSAPACIVAPFPHLLNAADIDPEIEKAFGEFQEIVQSIRTIRAEMKIPPRTPTDLYLQGDLTRAASLLPLLTALIPFDQIFQEPPPSSTTRITLYGIEFAIPLPAALQAQEKERLEKEKEKWIQQAQAIKERLANPDFLAKAPPELVAKTEALLEELTRRIHS